MSDWNISLLLSVSAAQMQMRHLKIQAGEYFSPIAYCSVWLRFINSNLLAPLGHRTFARTRVLLLDSPFFKVLSVMSGAKERLLCVCASDAYISCGSGVFFTSTLSASDLLWLRISTLPPPSRHHPRAQSHISHTWLIHTVYLLRDAGKPGQETNNGLSYTAHWSVWDFLFIFLTLFNPDQHLLGGE